MLCYHVQGDIRGLEWEKKAYKLKGVKGQELAEKKDKRQLRRHACQVFFFFYKWL